MFKKNCVLYIRQKQMFQTMVKGGSLEDLCLLIRTLLEKRKEIEENGKKFRAVDERILKEAEFLVYPEAEYVLKKSGRMLWG